MRLCVFILCLPVYALVYLFFGVSVLVLKGKALVFFLVWPSLRTVGCNFMVIFKSCRGRHLGCPTEKSASSC